MILTGESQERLVAKYERSHPDATHAQVTAYIIGIHDTLNLIDKKMREEKELEKFYQTKQQ